MLGRQKPYSNTKTCYWPIPTCSNRCTSLRHIKHSPCNTHHWLRHQQLLPPPFHHHHRHHHLPHSPPLPLLSHHPSPILRQPTPRPHHTPQTHHTAHQAQHPLRQRGSPTANTTTATLYMATHCSARSNPPPGAGHAMFTVWILSFYQLPSCSAKAKRSMRWDC